NQLKGKSSLNEWLSARHPFELNIVDSDETAIEVCHQYQFDVVVVDDTNDNINTKKLYAVLPILQDDITLLRYQGETRAQLEENVKAVFHAKKYRRIQQMLMLEPSVGSFSNLPSFSLN
ncbi:MAG TPA: hypothetical protein VFN95_11290, partial [Flavitalea sp.]|nr:hypothetical protein [Flavitalea sp.]